MANTLKKLGQGHAGNGADTAIYTCPAATKATVTALYICNVTNASKTFNINAVTSAGSASVANALHYQETLNANTTIREGAGIILNAGDFISANASAATAVTVTIFGIEQV